jgi:hypothetical protein
MILSRLEIAMSSTPLNSTPCCEQCDTPRTYDQFIANHTTSKPLGLFEAHDVCAICQLPYGSENLAFEMLDMPLEITNILGCRHVFGSACVKQMSWDNIDGRHQCCPLCRTEWWLEPDPLNCDITDAIKHRRSENIARDFQTDYGTARHLLYNEPEYADSYVPFGLEELWSKLNLTRMIGSALATEAIQKRIQRLQEGRIISIAEIAYHPKKVLEGNLMVDPFTFNNYHLPINSMKHAILGTLGSMRGSRLWQMYRDVVPQMNGVRDESYLVAIEDEWMKMFPNDQRDWVGLVLNILWIVDLVTLEEDALEDTSQEA